MNNPNIPPIVIVGSGGVARSLAASLRLHHLPLKGIITRTPELPPRYPEWSSLQRFSITQPFDTDAIFFLTVPDQHIIPIAKTIQCTQPSLLVHCAGSVDLQTLSDIHHNAAVFYPAQTLHPSKIIPFEGINVCIEATTETAKNALYTIAEIIGAIPHSMDSTQRVMLHIAAVFVSNFGNLMMSMAEEICQQHQIDYSILHPLILRTAQKAVENSPSQTQTGPAVRNDTTTIEKHLSLLPDHLKQIYALLTDAIQQKFNKRL